VTKDVVALRCGPGTGREVLQIKVVIGGPTTADIKGFNFDVLFDSDVLTDGPLSYVPGSAVDGGLLSQDGDDPLLSAEPALSDPDRLIVGFHRTNQLTGVQGKATENVVLQFSIKASLAGEFGPVLLKFENAEAVDPAGNILTGIAFSDQILLSVN